jgi:hypothetical protein
MMMMSARSPVVALVLLACACPGSGTGTTGSGGDEGEGEGEAAALANLVSTTTLDAEPLAVNGFAIASRGDGRFAVGYFVEGSQTVSCSLTGGETVQSDVYELHVTDEQPDGSLRSRVVDDFVPVMGSLAVDIAVDPNTDALLFAYNGGEVTATHCGATDLMLAQESGDTFTITPIATTGDTGATCRGDAGGDPYCNVGEVVGRFPSLALRNNNMAIAYMDNHFGFGDADNSQSDLELAYGNAPTTLALSSVHTETGAGRYTDITFTDDGRLLFAHVVLGGNVFLDNEGNQYTVDGGLYAGLRSEDGSITEQLLLASIQTASRVGVLAIGATLYVAIHNRSSEQLLLFVSIDNGATFASQPIEQRGRTGRQPNLLAIDGKPVLIYGHCRDDQNSDVCAADEDGIRVATPGPSVAAPPRRSTFVGDDEDFEGIGVHAAKSGTNEVVVVSLQSAQNKLVVHRLSVQP